MINYYKYKSSLILVPDKNVKYLNQKDMDILLKSENIIMDKLDKNLDVCRLIILGDWTQIPPSSYFVNSLGEKWIKVNNDFKYGVSKNFFLPVVRYSNMTPGFFINQNRALLLIDRPINYHMDAYYAYHLLKPYYIVDIWDGSLNYNGFIYQNRKYDIVIHYGHSNKNYFIFGNVKTDKLPISNIVISHGCNSLQLYYQKKQLVNAFCGFSYYCDGQTPANGSNRIIIYLLMKLLENKRSLSEALFLAKKMYIDENINCRMDKSFLTASSKQELIDLVSVIACNSDSDSNLLKSGNTKNLVRKNVLGKYKLPSYKDTLLLIITSQNKLLHIKLFEVGGKSIYLDDFDNYRYKNWNCPANIIQTFYKNERRVLINKQYLFIEFSVEVNLQMFYEL